MKQKLQYSLGFLFSSLNLGFGKPRIGDILITDRCPLNCEFCIYSCSMKGNDMNKEDIELLIKNYAKFKIPFIRITGGEPFLVYDKLLFSIKELNKYHLNFTVVTSGYFATTRKKAYEKLKPLRDIGLSRITISYDVMHKKIIKEQNYKNLLIVAVELKFDIEFNVTCWEGTNKLNLEEYASRYNADIGLIRVYPSKPKSSGSEYDEMTVKLAPYRHKPSLLVFLYRKLFNKIMICSQYTAFPDGNIYLCCVRQPLIGNFKTNNIDELFTAVKKKWFTYLTNSINLMFKYYPQISSPCEVCMLK